MILFRADANSNIGMGHVMRTLSIAEALSSNTSYPTIISGKQSIKFVVADETISDMIKDRGYEPIVLHTDYKNMDGEIPVWEELMPSIDADLIIVDSYYVTAPYLKFLREEVGTVAYIDDVLALPYPADLMINYNAYANLSSYYALYKKHETPEFLLGASYAPLREMFKNVEKKEQREKVQNVLISTGGSDELHIALELVRQLTTSSSFTFHLLIGAMNTDKEEIRALAGKNVVLHENVADMKSLISSMDLIVSAAGSTLYEICACGVPLITFSTADNQVPGAEAFEKLGLAVNVGDLREPESIDHTAVMSGTLDENAIEKLMNAVGMLAVDKEKRAKMSAAQQSLIDGRGAERLAGKLLEKVKKNIVTIWSPFF